MALNPEELKQLTGAGLVNEGAQNGSSAPRLAPQPAGDYVPTGTAFQAMREARRCAAESSGTTVQTALNVQKAAGQFLKARPRKTHALLQQQASGELPKVHPRRSGDLGELGAPGATEDEDGADEASMTLVNLVKARKLMAAWHVKEVTNDGGVELDFEGLGADGDPEALEQLHQTIANMAASQAVSGGGAGPSNTTAATTTGASTSAPTAAPTGALEGTPRTDEGPAGAAGAAAQFRASSALLRGPMTSRDPIVRGQMAAELEGLFQDDEEETGQEDGPQVSQSTPTMLGRSPALGRSEADLRAAVAESEASTHSRPASVSNRVQKVLLVLEGNEGKSVREALQQQTELLSHNIRTAWLQGRLKPKTIVILIVGTRGDVQPFVGIALELKKYGHRVRIASHKVYREWVELLGLEFYPIGGDPKVLSEFVVKHRGIMPGLDLKDAWAQREQVKEILYSTWGACVNPDPEHPDKPFKAEAIMANPPAYGHIHCAEKLGVPLHIVFTMPWTPTTCFPNPFARIKTEIGVQQTKAREVMNWLSYFAVEDLAWLGMAGMVKDYRRNVLGLTGWQKQHTSHAILHSQTPITYIWSPSLAERPHDWPAHCEVVGFTHVPLKELTAYTPPADIQKFLDDGPPPVFIGFGSLVMDKPEQLSKQIVDAILELGLRAIIQRGWGKLGSHLKPDEVPKEILFIDAAPHDWLFENVCAVVHHGGAGTTAAGLYAGKPTFIVPFFGDQPFWGAACHKAGVGPPPCPIDDLDKKRISNALMDLMMPARQKAAKEMMEKMHAEDGNRGAVDHFHRVLYAKEVMGSSATAPTLAKLAGGRFTARVVETTIQEEEDSDEAEEGRPLCGFLALPQDGVLPVPDGIAHRVHPNAKQAAGYSVDHK